MMNLLKNSDSFNFAFQNEAYFCNYCRKGKIRPIQFSLKQAIINCDNIDCESYLEKRPWECIITRPLSASSSLCKCKYNFLF